MKSVTIKRLLRIASEAAFWILMSSVVVAQSSVAGGTVLLVAKGAISMGSGATLDSYNSSAGPYVPGVHGTNVVAISNTNIAGAINLNSGVIYGRAVTAPGGTVVCSGASAVGDTNWVGSGNLGVEPGWSANDANVQINDETAPYTSGTIPTSGAIGGTNYTYLLNGASSSQYYMSSLALVASQTMMVNGNVTLYITGNLLVSGSAQIVIAPGSSLNLYVGGTAAISGQGIANLTLAPTNFTMHGLPTCTSIFYSGGDAFYGSVNAPEASLSFMGGSSAFGSFVAYNISISGVAVHADEALASSRRLTFAIYPQTGGQIVLAGSGAALASYSIQATTNLCGGTWVTLVTTNTDVNGLLNYVDQKANNYPRRFYRSVAF